MAPEHQPDCSRESHHPIWGRVAVEIAARHVKVMFILCMPQGCRPRGCQEQCGRVGENLSLGDDLQVKEQGGALSQCRRFRHLSWLLGVSVRSGHGEALSR